MCRKKNMEKEENCFQIFPFEGFWLLTRLRSQEFRNATCLRELTLKTDCFGACVKRIQSSFCALTKLEEDAKLARRNKRKSPQNPPNFFWTKKEESQKHCFPCFGKEKRNKVQVCCRRWTFTSQKISKVQASCPFLNHEKWVPRVSERRSFASSFTTTCQVKSCLQRTAGSLVTKFPIQPCLDWSI